MSLKLVKQHHTFIFKGVCPYCDNDLKVSVNEWIKEDDGWYAGELDVDCVSMPDFDSPEFDNWSLSHTKEVYEIWHPAVLKIKQFLYNNYRFDVQRTKTRS